MINKEDLLRGIFPLYLLRVVYKLLKFIKKNQLFDGNDKLFKKLSKDTLYYGEYGCGQSTIWMAKNTNAKINSVDTSSLWVQRVENKTKYFNNVKIKVIDCGELGNYGFPITYEKRHNFHFYINFFWYNKQDSPDTILIDGRFRVACFLTCLLKSKPGTKIIFDDYLNRPKYHLVEEYLKPIEFCGRQALFITPKKEAIYYEKAKLESEIERFLYVWD